MLTTASAQLPERRLSSVDLFCMQTYQPPAKDPVKRLRAIALGLGCVCLALLVSLGIAVSQASGMERERDLLARELGSVRKAQLKTDLAAKDREMVAATYALETMVRRDIVDEQMALQERRSAELQRLAQRIQSERLVAADCVTPRSIRMASNL